MRREIENDRDRVVAVAGRKPSQACDFASGQRLQTFLRAGVTRDLAQKLSTAWRNAVACSCMDSAREAENVLFQVSAIRRQAKLFFSPWSEERLEATAFLIGGGDRKCPLLTEVRHDPPLHRRHQPAATEEISVRVDETPAASWRSTGFDQGRAVVPRGKAESR